MGDPVRVVRPDRIIDHYPSETPESLFFHDRIQMSAEAHRREMEQFVKPEVLDQLEAMMDREFLGLPDPS